MGNPRAQYTLEFKMEAVRMVRNGQSQSAVAKILGLSARRNRGDLYGFHWVTIRCTVQSPKPLP